MDNKLPLNAKIVVIIAIAAAAAAAVILVIILTGGGLAIPGGGDSGKDINSEVAVETSGPDVAAEPDVASGPENDSGTDASKGASNSGSAGGGNAVYDYNDPTTYIPGIPDKRALEEMYVLLEGYWITTDALFVGFIKEGGEYWIEYGLFQSGFGVKGKIVDGCAKGEYEAVLTIKTPAAPATEMDDARPERTEDININLAGLIPYAAIDVKADNLGNSGWYTYEPGGYDIDSAYNNWAG